MKLVLAHEVGPIAAAREVLDRFGVASRLKHIGEFVWRGGTLRFVVEDQGGMPRSAGYELRADWAAPIFEPLPGPDQALARGASPVIEGRWIRGSAGYMLRIGLDLGAPLAIFIRSDRLQSSVPFLRRPRAMVEHALAADLAAYVEWFLDTCEPVPAATQAAAHRMRELLPDF